MRHAIRPSLIAVAIVLGLLCSGPATAQSGPAESAPGGDPSPAVVVNGLPPTGPAPAKDYVHIRPDAPFTVDPGMQLIGSNVQLDLGPAQDAPALSRSFSGITDTGSFPADPVIAAGNSYVVACVNRHVACFNKSGKRLFQSHFANFFSPIGTSGINLFDPWCLWDPFANRFMVSCVGRDDTNKRSYNYLAISKNESPLNGWYMYKNDMSLDGSTPTNNWNDYPRMAVDRNCIYFTANQFAFGGGFQYAKIRVIQNKSTLLSGGASQLWWDFWNIKMPGTSTNAFSIRPCMTHDSAASSSPYYLVNSYNGGGSKINLYAITNTTSRSPGPSFASTAVTVGTYQQPYNAIQQGGSETVELFGGAQLFNAVMRNGSIWCAHPIRLGSSSTTGAALRWYEFRPNSWPTSGSPSKRQESSFYSTNSWYFYPVVEVNANDEVAIVFNRSSANDYVGIRWTGRQPSDPLNTLEGSAELKAGEAYYVRKASGRNRWGDYNGASVAPDGSIWFVSMYAESNPANKWGTWIGRVYEPQDEDVRYWVSSFGNTQGTNLLGFSGSSIKTSVALPSANSPDAVCMDPFNYRVLVFDNDRVYRYYVDDGQGTLPGSVFSSTLTTGGGQIQWGGVDEGGGIFWVTSNGSLYRADSISGSGTTLLRTVSGVSFNACAYNPATGGYVAVAYSPARIYFFARNGAVTRILTGPGSMSGIDHDPFSGNFIISRFGGTGQGLVRMTQTGTLTTFGPTNSPILDTANSVECREQPSALYFGTDYGSNPQHLWYATSGGSVVSLHASSGLFGPSDLELHRQRTLWATTRFRVGNTGTLYLDFGPAFAGDTYQVASSVGYLPGYSLPGGWQHLVPGDFLVIASLLGLDGGAIWKNFAGFLDVNGIGTAQVAVPSIPSLRGLTVYYGAVAYNNIEGIKAVSSSCSVTIE